MKLGSDFVMVRVSSTLNTFLGVIKDENGKEVKLVVNPDWRPTHHVRICAEVVAVPQYLSGRDNPLYENNPGSPKPVSYRSHDKINEQMEMMPKLYRKTANIPYLCGKYVPDFQTHAGVEPEVPVGSTIYFHYNSLLNTSNYMWSEPPGPDQDMGDLIYLIHYSQIFCYVVGGKITMLNGYVLVSEYYDGSPDEIEVNGQKMFGKVQNGIVTEIRTKPKYLTGMVEHIGKGIGKDIRQTEPGALVMFRPSSEFRNTIEGVTYYVMRHWDLVAEWLSDSEIRHVEELARQQGVVIEFNKLIPIGDYVMIVPEEQEISKNIVTHVFDPNAITQDFKPGEIFVPHTAVSQEKKKKIHKYGVGTVLLQGELCAKNFVGKKVAFEKSAHYIWVEEFKVVLTRYGDIYGNYETTRDDNKDIVEEARSKGPGAVH